MEAANDSAPEPGEASPVSTHAPSPRERISGWLELAASAAVIAVSLAAVAAFLSLL